jgi:hypothetical protein
MHDIAVDTQVTLDWQTEEGRLKGFRTLDKCGAYDKGKNSRGKNKG